MAATQSRICIVALVAVAIFAMIENSAALDSPAPAPAPDSSAGVPVPSLAAGCAVAVISFIFGSALRM
ncbi:hypothetical protein F511_04638 [Dorcoceras hygrometricum]|uniref:Uncharacterized protein n=1 Tax=Dorcoceras hygrometricum TaxID=472368 RepID=A0A2Z7BS09_9LAMI|nr:hypothetical protein F511_04638 [Dorcoceras hygrometricum]